MGFAVTFHSKEKASHSKPKSQPKASHSKLFSARVRVLGFAVTCSFFLFSTEQKACSCSRHARLEAWSDFGRQKWPFRLKKGLFAFDARRQTWQCGRVERNPEISAFFFRGHVERNPENSAPCWLKIGSSASQGKSGRIEGEKLGRSRHHSGPFRPVPARPDPARD